MSVGMYVHCHVIPRNLYVIFEVCFVLLMTLCVVHREAESQLSSDTDLEDPDGKNAKTGKVLVCISNLHLFIFYTCSCAIRVTWGLEPIPASIGWKTVKHPGLVSSTSQD